MFNEDLLHFAWRYKRFDTQGLCTQQGEPIEILDWGQPNTNAGPDFENAKIRVGQTLWAGNVEMHLKASDWMRHGHESDPAYGNVVLHVVYEHDSGPPPNVPVLCLKDRLPSDLLTKYKQLMEAATWVPCQALLGKVDAPSRAFWLQRMLTERLEDKTQLVKVLLSNYQNDWDQAFLALLCRYLAGPVNADTMSQLADKLHHSVIAKHSAQLFQVEALVFGAAGLLQRDFQDEYPKRLAQEFDFLQKKHHLSMLPATSWKMARMRPIGLPTVRLAQLSAMLRERPRLFSECLACKTPVQFKALFSVPLSDYWKTHYVFDKESKSISKQVGQDMSDILIINVVAPMMFVYARMHGHYDMADAVFGLLESLESEDNLIVRGWADLGWKSKNAADSQSLIQLKKHYCDNKSCLKCGIGNRIFL